MGNCCAGCECCDDLRRILKEYEERESHWQNLYMLMQRYQASYRTMKSPSEKVFKGLAKYRKLLGLDNGILRENDR